MRWGCGLFVACVRVCWARRARESDAEARTEKQQTKQPCCLSAGSLSLTFVDFVHARPKTHKSATFLPVPLLQNLLAWPTQRSYTCFLICLVSHPTRGCCYSQKDIKKREKREATGHQAPAAPPVVGWLVGWLAPSPSACAGSLHQLSPAHPNPQPPKNPNHR